MRTLQPKTLLEHGNEFQEFAFVLVVVDNLLEFVCVDDNVVGCVALHSYSQDTAEVACLYVKQSHEGLGYGKALVEAAEERARERGIGSAFVLTTRAVSFFEKLGYESADLAMVPEERVRKFEESDRSSKVLSKTLN